MGFHNHSDRFRPLIDRVVEPFPNGLFYGLLTGPLFATYKSWDDPSATTKGESVWSELDFLGEEFGESKTGLRLLSG